MEKTITEINNKTLKQVLVVDDMGHVFRNNEPVNTFEKANHLAIHLRFTDDTSKDLYVHQLVGLAFFGVLTSRKNKTAIHHKNGNKFDNRVSNLELTTFGENIKNYWHIEAQTQSKTVYDEEKIADGLVTLKHKGILIPDYSISITGHVYKWNKKVNKWQEIKRYVGNKKYPSNVLVSIHGHGISLSQLMAQNFMKLEDRKFKVHQIDRGNGFENDFTIRNLRVAYSGDSVVKETVA
ncbi:HNH endonuclease [Weissella paramesenteroides]|uniref:HNH endonuclease n=1 Tax=Weissella paramesenteroides TaxID=1249 RepID=UPI003981CBE8